MITDQQLIASLIEENESLKKQIQKIELAAEIVPYCRLSIYEDLTYKKIFPSFLKFLKLKNIEDVNLEVGKNSNDHFLKEYITAFFESKKIKNTEIVSIENNGEVKKILIHSVRVDSEKMAIVLFTDITNAFYHHLPNSERNQKLAKLGEQLLSITHDIVNPLAMVEYSAFNIAKKVDGDDIHQKLKELRYSNSLALNIIKNVKTYANLNDDKIVKEEIVLKNVLSEAIEHMQRKMNLLKITFSLDNDFENFNIYCNRTEMYQVFINLISNSIDAIKELDDKWLHIKFNKFEDDKVSILFIDSGKGISKDISDMIFNPFFSTKKKNGGMGLGLSIVKDRIEKNGGEIAVYDFSENTAFEVLIPGKLNKMI